MFHLLVGEGRIVEISEVLADTWTFEATLICHYAFKIGRWHVIQCTKVSRHMLKKSAVVFADDEKNPFE